MTCEIKSEHHPVQIRCSFPEVNETKRDFSVYFHSSGGSQNVVANCIFNKASNCMAEEDFEVTLEGLNADSLTVPDSFATKTGMFVCQKGDLPFIKNCEFPLTGNSTAGNSFNSEVGYGTTTNVIPSFVTNEHSRNEDDNKLLIICATVSAIVVLIVLSVLITILWFKRRKTRRRRERSEKPGFKSNELVKGELNAEVTEILQSFITAKCKVPGNGFDIIAVQEITDKEYPLLDAKNSGVSYTRRSSEDSTFSSQSQANLIPH